MSVLAGLLILLSLVILLVALVSPKVFAKKGTVNPSRWRGVALSVVVFFIGAGIEGPQEETSVGDRMAQKEEPAIEETVPVQVSPQAKTTFDDNAGGQTAPKITVPAMSITDYRVKCLKADDATFAADCLGKPVEGVLYFGSPSANDTKQMMSIPGNYEDIFWVTFSAVPDWGAKEPVRWTGRRETIMAKIAARSVNGGANFENARIVRNDAWRDRAVQMIKAREGVLEAMWPHETVALWVVMRNNGSKRDNDARQFCAEVWRAGRPEKDWVMVTILDATRLLQDERVEIGKARCQ